MEQVDEGGEATMNVDTGRQGGQEDMQSLTARVDTMSEMFAKIMSQMSDTNTKMDAIMMNLGPQGPQALEMEAIKEQMKQSDEKNEVRFKKLEETAYQNKKKEVRFDKLLTRWGGLTKGLVRRLTFVGDTDMGGASGAGSSKDGGFLEILGGDSKSWGAGPRRGSSVPDRPNRGGPGGSDGQGSHRGKAKDCRCGFRASGGGSRRRPSRSRPEW